MLRKLQSIKINRLILFGIIFLAVLLLYYPALTTYFSQDDFFMFKVSQTNGSVGGFLNLFNVHPFMEYGISFYRPIFREALHNLYYSIFGLNHIPFRLLLLLIHFVNIILVYLFSYSVFRRRWFSFFTALFFGISSANVSLLYYLAGGIEASGATMFALLSLIFYKKYMDKNGLRFQLLSLLFFVLALASHEIILSVPLILVGLVLMSYPKKVWLKHLLKLWPFFILPFFVIYIDIFKIGFSKGEAEYKFIFNIKTLIQSFSWYWAWAFGLPETLIDFVLPGLKLNPTLMRYWGNYYKFIFTFFGISISILALFACYLIKNKKEIFDKKFLFLIFWFLAGLLPVILLPAHKSSHYLVFTLPAFWGAITYICLAFFNTFSKTSQRVATIFVSIFLISSFLLSTFSAKLGETNYWAATRGKLASKLITQIKLTYPSVPRSANIYIKNDPNYPHLTDEWGGTSKQASLILNGSDALQLLYKDPTIKVYYEDLEKPSKDSRNLLQLEAKLN